jgi:hypothetical protein
MFFVNKKHGKPTSAETSPRSKWDVAIAAWMMLPHV